MQKNVAYLVHLVPPFSDGGVLGSMLRSSPAWENASPGQYIGFPGYI